MRGIAWICFVVLSVISSAAVGQTHRYGPNVDLTGVLVTATADAKITIDEKPHSFSALQLLKPVNVLCGSADKDCTPELGVMFLQLTMRGPQFEQFKKLQGKTVRVSGTLYHSETGHHFTSVLIDVRSITP